MCHCLSVLSNGNDGCKDAIIAADALGPLLAALRTHVASADACKYTCRVLNALSQGNGTRKEAIIAAGVVTTLTQVYRLHEDDLSRRTLTSLGFGVDGARM
jgi:hypothetical protein